jgi:hypothetical protein
LGKKSLPFIEKKLKKPGLIYPKNHESTEKNLDSDTGPFASILGQTKKKPSIFNFKSPLWTRP